MAAVEEEEMERGRGRCGAIFISGVKKNLIGELAVRGTDEWAWVKARKAAAAVAAIDKQSVLDLAVLSALEMSFYYYSFIQWFDLSSVFILTSTHLVRGRAKCPA